jgi:hypothetical protein
MDKYEELLEIDLSDVGNTLVELSWIGAPGWRTTESIRNLLKAGSLRVETIHAIKALLETMGSYMCLEYN